MGQSTPDFSYHFLGKVKDKSDHSLAQVAGEWTKGV